MLNIAVVMEDLEDREGPPRLIGTGYVTLSDDDPRGGTVQDIITGGCLAQGCPSGGWSATHSWAKVYLVREDHSWSEVVL